MGQPLGKGPDADQVNVEHLVKNLSIEEGGDTNWETNISKLSAAIGHRNKGMEDKVKDELGRQPLSMAAIYQRAVREPERFEHAGGYKIFNTIGGKRQLINELNKSRTQLKKNADALLLEGDDALIRVPHRAEVSNYDEKSVVTDSIPPLVDIALDLCQLSSFYVSGEMDFFGVSLGSILFSTIGTTRQAFFDDSQDTTPRERLIVSGLNLCTLGVFGLLNESRKSYNIGGKTKALIGHKAIEGMESFVSLCLGSYSILLSRIDTNYPQLSDWEYGVRLSNVLSSLICMPYTAVCINEFLLLTTKVQDKSVMAHLMIHNRFQTKATLFVMHASEVASHLVLVVLAFLTRPLGIVKFVSCYMVCNILGSLMALSKSKWPPQNKRYGKEMEPSTDVPNMSVASPTTSLSYSAWLSKSMLNSLPWNALMDFTISGRFPRWTCLHELDSESQRLLIRWNLLSRVFILWGAAWVVVCWRILSNYGSMTFTRIDMRNATNPITTHNVSLYKRSTQQLGSIAGASVVYIPESYWGQLAIDWKHQVLVFVPIFGLLIYIACLGRHYWLGRFRRGQVVATSYSLLMEMSSNSKADEAMYSSSVSPASR